MHPADQGLWTWLKVYRRHGADLREIVESMLLSCTIPLGSDHEQPHGLQGFAARLVARAGLPNLYFQLPANSLS